MASRLVVEWTRATVRAAWAEGGGGAGRLRAIQSRPIGVGGEIAKTLRDLLKGAGSVPVEVIGVVPRELVITRAVKFPATDPAELSQMVALYAKTQLPYPAEQAVMDFHVVQQEGGFSTIAVAACQREVIDRQLGILREAGLAPKLLTVSSWGVAGWYRHAVRTKTAQEPTLIVNVDETRTDLVLVTGERILSSRSLAQGAQDWTDPAEAGELLAVEVERSRSAARKELPGADVRSLLLTGVSTAGQWRESLSQRFGLPVAVMEWTTLLKAGALREPVSPSLSPVVVWGLAVGGLRGLLNLSPPEMRETIRHRRQARELATLALLLAAVLSFGAGGLALHGFRERRLAVELDRALATVEPAARRIQEHTQAAQFVTSLLEQRRQLAAHLSGVFRATPSDVMLDGLTFERGRREFVVRGSAPSTQAVLEYIQQLERLEGIGEARLNYSTQRSSLSGPRTEFELALLEGENPASVGRRQ